MQVTVDSNKTASEEVHELAHRSAEGIDVTLLWDSGADRVFVVVDDERRDEQFLIAVGNDSALDAFHHPYAYRHWGDGGQQLAGSAEIERVA